MGTSSLGYREIISTSLLATSRKANRDLGDRGNFCPVRTQLSGLAGKLSVYAFYVTAGNFARSAL